MMTVNTPIWGGARIIKKVYLRNKIYYKYA